MKNQTLSFVLLTQGELKLSSPPDAFDPVIHSHLLVLQVKEGIMYVIVYAKVKTLRSKFQTNESHKLNSNLIFNV